jgi:hypothetical protein
MDIGLALGLNGIQDIPDNEYFAIDRLSNSYLWRLINKTPAHAQVATEKTEAMTLGSAVHLAILQPEMVAKGIIQGPKDRRGKKWADALEEAETTGAMLLVEKDYHACMAMRDAVWNNSALASILTGDGAQYEKAALFEHRGFRCKLKMDCAKDVLIDLKTSIDASPRGFAQSCAAYGYHQQAASYRYGWNKAAGTEIRTFLFLVVEKSPPYAPAIYELDAQSMAEGWASWNTALDIHSACVEQKHFPAYPPETVLLSLPPYAFKHTNPREITLTGDMR